MIEVHPCRAALLLPFCIVFAGQRAAIGDVDPARRKVESGLVEPVVRSNDSHPQMRLLDRMRHYRVPGLSIAVIDGGRLAWAQGYGVRERGRSDRVGPETLFQIASLAKLLTALLAVKLVEQGVLHLDQDVNDVLVRWKVPPSPFTADSAVTLRRLLSHTAGINVSGFTPYERGVPLPTLTDDLLGLPPARTPALGVEAVPGSSWRYSGGGYQIVQQLIEDATGQPFTALMKRHVLIPLGMGHTHYEEPVSPALASLVASGHLPTGAPMAGGWQVVPELAAGGGWSTASDIAKLIIAIQDATAGRGGQVLSRQSAEMMVTPVRDGYGLGLFVEGQGDAVQFNHTGHNTGYRAMLVGHPFTGQGAVVLSNGDSDGGGLVFEVIRAIAGVYRWPDYQPIRRTEITLSRAVLDRFAGSYQVEGAGVFRVFRQGDSLHIVAPPLGSRAVQMHAMESAKFFVRTDPVTFSFTVDSDNAAALLHVDAPGATLRGRRITDRPD